MIVLVIVAAVLAAGALVTLGASRLIAWRHSPPGRLIEVGGLRQHILELGQGAEPDPTSPPLVLIHGAGCNLEDMRVAFEGRLGLHRRVILIDRPGHGWSERSGRDSHLPTFQAAVLRDLLDRLGIDRAVIVGHSWGGALALTFALDHPRRVAGLVLVAPPTHPRLRRLTRLYAGPALPVAGWLFAHTLALPLSALAFGAGLRVAFAPQSPPDDYAGRSAAYLMLRPAAFLANARDMAGLQAFLARQAPRYGELETPCVIVSGDRDGVVPLPRHAMAFAAAVPHAELLVLAGIGHMAHHAAPERIVAAIERVVENSR